MPRRLSEELTREELIDPQLEKAGWYLRDHSRVKIEIPVDGYDAEPWNGISDYTLYREDGEVLAVVEAKKTAVDVRLAEVTRQFETYVTQDICNADQIRFLRGVQSTLLQKRHLETSDLYEPPLDMFGADAVERWFTERDVKEVVDFANRMAV